MSWTEFVVYVDSETVERRFETLDEAIDAAEALGVDCQVFVEERRKIMEKVCDVLGSEPE